MQNAKKLSAVLVTVFLLFGLAGWSQAGQIEANEDFTLQQDDSIEGNAYLAGGSLNILGNVAGDLLAGSGNLMISGNIEDDVLAAAGTLNLSGPVSGDARIAGGNISVGSDIAGDLVAAGGTINIFSNSKVGGDLYVVGGDVKASGEVIGETKLAAGNARIEGKMSGPVSIRAEKLIIGEGAVIEGDLDYYSPTEADIAPSAQIMGETNFHRVASHQAANKRQLAKFFGFAGVIKLLAMIVVGLVLVLGFKKFSTQVVSKAGDKFGSETLRGLILLVVLPVASLLLLASLIGSLFGILVGILWLASMILGGMYAGILLGAMLDKLWYKNEKIELSWRNAVVGIVILFIVGFVPVLGWLVGFLFFLASLGSVSQVAYEKLIKQN